MKYIKEYSIEFSEECEASSFEEAEQIMDDMAEKEYPGECFSHGDVEIIEE